MRSLGDVTNCTSRVYSSVCVKHEGSKSWTNIEDRRYINGENLRSDSRRQDLGHKFQESYDVGGVI